MAGLGVLIGTYAKGRDALRYTGMRDADVLKEIIHNLADVFNTSAPLLKDQLVDYVIKRWGLDPYALGSYPFAGAHEVNISTDSKLFFRGCSNTLCALIAVQAY